MLKEHRQEIVKKLPSEISKKNYESFSLDTILLLTGR